MDIFVLAAEPSGDLHGAKLISALLKKSPSLRIKAISGPKMRELPIIHSSVSMEQLQVMGFLDVLVAAPKLIPLFFSIRNEILRLNPKVVVCIDYPGFNLRLEKSLKKRGYRGKLVHYICPTVWAWGKHRTFQMEQTLDLLLTFFPFEKNCFNPQKLSVEYVGHPLTQTIRYTPTPRKHLLALFPGSRRREIERNLPIQLQAAAHLLTLDPTLELAISVAHSDFESLIQNLSQKFSHHLICPQNQYELMRSCRLAIATSGTVTLELALYRTPTIVTFAIRPLDAWIATKIFHINLPFYCIVNILLSKAVFPELFGPNLQLPSLSAHTQELWFNEKTRDRIMEDCKEVGTLLGDHASSESAASLIAALVF